ncbi:hypothetical protein MVEN_00052700 [Mycena venus]|uniref:Uncharacterized protein n=1 Tax=Mycena venus TaxID=2733690 RepID=A0A8H6Z723_9AGAR|nr:hypothetical protein MVEN_00052700 [Mycena venus]
MIVIFPHNHFIKPSKRTRRTATTVLAGHFDVRSPRDELTTLSNGVDPYPPMLQPEDDATRRQRKRKKKERESKGKGAMQNAQKDPLGKGVDAVLVANELSRSVEQPSAAAKAFLQATYIATMQQSVTPPALASPLLRPSTPRVDAEPIKLFQHVARVVPAASHPQPEETACGHEKRVEGIGGGLSATV